MGFKFRQGLGGILFSVLLGATALAQAGAAGQRVRVLVYVTGRIPTKLVQRAGTEMAGIFRSGGIAVEWVNCSGRDSGECQLKEDRNQFVLHIVSKGRTSTDSVYGEAFLGPDGAGKYADVFYDRIEEAQRDYGVDRAPLMAAVAAHEIGHLLLGLHAHAWSGIMAPLWTKESLLLMSTGNLFFNREEMSRMKARVLQDERRTTTFRAKAID